MEQLKPLPELKVVRDTYCSQKTADDVLRYLWEHAPDLVQALMELEHVGVHSDYNYGEGLGRIIIFINENVSKEIKIPTTNLGMLDLLFEISRRLRKAQNLSDRIIKGKPLAPSPTGPWPELPVLPIKPMKAPPFQIVQEDVDRIIADTYVRRPDLFYEVVESMRRDDTGPDCIYHQLTEVLREVAPSQHKLNVDFKVMPEIVRRLSEVCEIEK